MKWAKTKIDNLVSEEEKKKTGMKARNVRLMEVFELKELLEGLNKEYLNSKAKIRFPKIMVSNQYSVYPVSLEMNGHYLILVAIDGKLIYVIALPKRDCEGRERAVDLKPEEALGKNLSEVTLNTSRNEGVIPVKGVPLETADKLTKLKKRLEEKVAEIFFTTFLKKT